MWFWLSIEACAAPAFLTVPLIHVSQFQSIRQGPKPEFSVFPPLILHFNHCFDVVTFGWWQPFNVQLEHVTGVAWLVATLPRSEEIRSANDVISSLASMEYGRGDADAEAVFPYLLTKRN